MLPSRFSASARTDRRLANVHPIWVYLEKMTKIIQVRNVPDEVHETLRKRAAEERKSLSEYVLGELERVASRPTMSEALARIKEREQIELPMSAAELIREGREERTDDVMEALGIDAATESDDH